MMGLSEPESNMSTMRKEKNSGWVKREIGFVASLDNLRKCTMLCCLVVVLKTLIQEICEGKCNIWC